MVTTPSKRALPVAVIRGRSVTESRAGSRVIPPRWCNTSGCTTRLAPPGKVASNARRRRRQLLLARAWSAAGFATLSGALFGVPQLVDRRGRRIWGLWDIHLTGVAP